VKKPPPPKKRRVPPRNPPAPREIVERALRLAAQSTPEDAAEQLKREWKPGERRPPSWRTIRRWQHGMNGQAAVAAEVLGLPTMAPPPTPAPAAPEPPPTDADRKVDELVARSRTWRRVQEALARALTPYPEAARAVAAELKRIDL
jgi:hypothetical protein